jgi:peptidoglycan/LPS O-acetylase OafA/YrhL
MLSAELLYRATPFQLDSLLLGGLAALLWRGAHRDRLTALARIVALIAALIAVIYLMLTLHLSNPNWRAGYVYPSWKFTWGLEFVNIFTTAVILCVLETSHALQRLLCLRPLRWLGRISYGAYVLHDIVHDLYVHIVVHLGNRFPLLIAHRDGASMLLAFAGTLLLAWLSFRFFESPFLNLKERFTRRSTA